MSKPIKISIIIGIVVLLVFGGWYVFKKRECVNGVLYIPSSEWDNSREFKSDKGKVGDYYVSNRRNFKTSEDAIRACMWE